MQKWKTKKFLSLLTVGAVSASMLIGTGVTAMASESSSDELAQALATAIAEALENNSDLENSLAAMAEDGDMSASVQELVDNMMSQSEGEATDTEEADAEDAEDAEMVTDEEADQNETFNVGIVTFDAPSSWFPLMSSEQFVAISSPSIDQMFYVSSEEAEGEADSLLPDALAEQAVDLLKESLKDELESEPEILEPVILQGMYTSVVKADDAYCLIANRGNNIIVLMFINDTDSPDALIEILESVEIEDATGETDLSSLFPVEESVEEVVEEAVAEDSADSEESAEDNVSADLEIVEIQ